MLQNFLAIIRTRAARKPIAEMPMPASTPKPQIWAVVSLGSYWGVGYWQEEDWVRRRMQMMYKILDRFFI